ncbi:MAG TPA: serine/threonine-protein kinase [Pseudonocardiaceae bacterium]|nr:serine/threonine-protein kinase [Pseudonocardiaceae bacterium]
MNSPGPAPRLVDGRFELLQRLGGGGMGVVWRARDNALHRDVALKEVRPPDSVAGDSNSVDPRETRQRVLREARALARLRHPNVVIIHHIADTPEHPHPWLVMELVTGGSLADRLEKGPLTVPEAARIGRGVLSALRAAHAVGILHRDIKPGNVLLRTDGSPVLTDFGIAAIRDATALTVAGSVIGSPEYIAPERLRGEEGNPASDLWSLAMMLYVAVEGRHPLRRATMLATLAAVLDESLPPPVHAGPLGPALSAVLVKDPRARPDAERFDRMLAAAEYPPPAWAPQPPPSYPPQPAYPPPTGGWAQPANRPWSPQRRRRRALLAAVSVVVLVVAGVLTWTLLPKTPNAGGTPAARQAASHSTPPTGPTRGTVPPATTAAPRDLLTPDGVRTMIGTMTRAMGPKVLELVIYQNYATAEAPTAADPKLYDDIDYRNGVTTHSPGGTVDTSTDAPIDLSAINWDVLPTLLRKAQDTLNVPKPTNVYIIVESDMDMDDSGNTTLNPVIRVYRADDYGGGYLTADLKGDILDTMPRS